MLNFYFNKVTLYTTKNFEANILVIFKNEVQNKLLNTEKCMIVIWIFELYYYKIIIFFINSIILLGLADLRK